MAYTLPYSTYDLPSRRRDPSRHLLAGPNGPHLPARHFSHQPSPRINPLAVPPPASSYLTSTRKDRGHTLGPVFDDDNHAAEEVHLARRMQLLARLGGADDRTNPAHVTHFDPSTIDLQHQVQLQELALQERQNLQQQQQQLQAQLGLQQLHLARRGHAGLVRNASEVPLLGPQQPTARPPSTTLRQRFDVTVDQDSRMKNDRAEKIQALLRGSDAGQEALRVLDTGATPIMRGEEMCDPIPPDPRSQYDQRGSQNVAGPRDAAIAAQRRLQAQLALRRIHQHPGTAHDGLPQSQSSESKPCAALLPVTDKVSVDSVSPTVRVAEDTSSVTPSPTSPQSNGSGNPPADSLPSIPAKPIPSKGRFAQARESAGNTPFGELTSLLARRSAQTAAANANAIATPGADVAPIATEPNLPSQDRMAARQALAMLGQGRPSALPVPAAASMSGRSTSDPTPLTPTTGPTHQATIATRAAEYTRSISLGGVSGKEGQRSLRTIRQPIGPPAPANELGERNFAALARQRAGKGLGMLGRRREIGASGLADGEEGRSGQTSPVVA